MQRVPKKTSIVKADLQKSTASQGDCSWAVHTKNSTASHGDDYTPTFYKKLNEDRHPERGNYFRVEWV